MGWDGMRRDGMKWDGIEWDRITVLQKGISLSTGQTIKSVSLIPQNGIAIHNGLCPEKSVIHYTLLVISPTLCASTTGASPMMRIEVCLSAFSLEWKRIRVQQRVISIILLYKIKRSYVL